MQQVRLAAKCGFNSILAGQHYLSEPYQMLQSIPLLGRISGECPTMRVGTGILLLPLLNPVEAAEQIATLDIMTSGRFILGIGLGYRKVEFAVFGIPKDESLPRFKENLEVMKELFAKDEVTFEGSHFALHNVSMTLKPIQKPNPPIWFGGDSDGSVRRAAELGDTWYANPHVSFDTLRRQVALYQDALTKEGKRFPSEFPIRRELSISGTSDRAYELAEQYLAEKYSTYRKWGQDTVLPKSETFDRPFDELAHERFIIGSPNECIEQISKLREKLGFNHFVFRVQWPGMKHSDAMDAINLLGTKVIPHFKDSKA